MTTEDVEMTNNLPLPQKAIFMHLYFNKATLKHSPYFYGFEVKIPNVEERRYFRRDTVNAMVRKGIIQMVVHICGTYYELNPRFCLR